MSVLDSILVLILIIEVVTMVIVPFIVSGSPIAVTRAGADAAIGRLSDWAKWMAGLQTATLAALGALTKESRVAISTFPAVATVVFMGAALFCSAWVLSSLANITLAMSAVPEKDQIRKEPDTIFDIYEQPLYGAFIDRKTDSTTLTRREEWRRIAVPSLNYMVTLQHWMWGLGLVAFAAFLLSLFC